MMKCSVFVATSLDGYLARPDGSIDWLNQANALIPAGADLGFDHFLSSVDALVMGRNTFEQVLSFEKWPYPSTPVIVLSRRLKKLPLNAPSNVSLSSENPKQLVTRLSAENINHLYVDGGLVIQSFFAANLINEITVTIIPVLIGEGKTLFGNCARDIKLELVTSKAFTFGFVQNKYLTVLSIALENEDSNQA